MVRRSLAGFLLFVAALLVASVFFVMREDPRPADGVKSGSGDYRRIVSLSPSITETMYELGLGDRLAGVTRFCRYPPEAREKPKVGGYLDPDYEAIAALEPDLVFLLPGHESVRKLLDELGVPYVEAPNDRIGDILETFTIIGRTCGVEERAAEIVAVSRARLDAVRERCAGRPRPRVLVSVGRNLGSGGLQEIYVAGPGTYFDELIDLAGGMNAYHGEAVEYPVLSAEGLLHLNPDVIIDIVTGSDRQGLSNTAIAAEWESVPGVRAVRNGRVHVLDRDYAVIPGPRFIYLLNDLVSIIHPELREERP